MKHDFKEIDPVCAKRTFDVLTSFNINIAAIQETPKILAQPAISLRNRGQIFNESGVSKLSIPILTKYLTLYRKPVSLLKAYKLLPHNANVAKNLAESFKVESTADLQDEQNLENMRAIMLSEYLKQHLGFSGDQLTKFWVSYGRTRHKSATSILKLIDILKNELHFTDEKIRSNAFVIHADPENLSSLLQQQTILDVDVRTILTRRPKTMMTSVECITKTVENLKLFNIPSKALEQCPDILTLSPDTVLERLKDIKRIKEFDSLFSNPRVLKLVHYQKKAKARLMALQKLKYQNASLHVLSADGATFENYAREGADKTAGADTIIYLANECGKTKVEVRKLLSRHPFWKCIPLRLVKENFELLTRYHFQTSTIYQNVHLLLYPTQKIIEKLEYVRNDPEYLHANPVQILSLTLYFIEFDHHFSGDGVWTAEHSRTSENSEVEIVTDVVDFGGKKNYNKTENKTKK